MKKSSLLTAITLIFLVSQVGLAQQEDVVLGKDRMEWLKILREHKESKFRRAAVIALTVIGPARPGVMPGLIKALEADADPEIRREIASTISTFKAEEAKSAVDTLAARMEEDDSPKVREASARALGKLASVAPIHVMGLGRALKDKSPGVRTAAAEALVSYGDKAKIVLPQLLEAAQDAKGDVFTRLYAVQILGKQAGDDEKVAGALGAILADKDTPTNLRQGIAAALTSMGPSASVALAPLADVAVERVLDIELRRAAAGTLVSIGAKSAAAWPKVKGLLEDPDVGVRYQIVRLAGIVGKGNAEVSTALVKALGKEQNVEVLLAVVQEVGELGIAESAAELDRLVRTDLRQSIREAAQASLKKVK